jgi:hypothetical protein
VWKGLKWTVICMIPLVVFVTGQSLIPFLQEQLSILIGPLDVRVSTEPVIGVHYTEIGIVLEILLTAVGIALARAVSRLSDVSHRWLGTIIGVISSVPIWMVTLVHHGGIPLRLLLFAQTGFFLYSIPACLFGIASDLVHRPGRRK